MNRSGPTLAFILLLAVAFLAEPAVAQRPRPSIGIAVESVLSTSQGLGIGFRGRAATAVNGDFSVAAGASLVGFIFGGRDDASYLFWPQVSGIVAIGNAGPDRSAYVLGGVGLYVPIRHDKEGRGGPAIHGGMGWVKRLYETQLFYEINPALVVGESKVSLAIPFRLGIIF